MKIIKFVINWFRLAFIAAPSNFLSNILSNPVNALVSSCYIFILSPFIAWDEVAWEAEYASIHKSLDELDEEDKKQIIAKVYKDLEKIPLRFHHILEKVDPAVLHGAISSISNLIERSLDLQELRFRRKPKVYLFRDSTLRINKNRIIVADCAAEIVHIQNLDRETSQTLIHWMMDVIPYHPELFDEEIQITREKDGNFGFNLISD